MKISKKLISLLLVLVLSLSMAVTALAQMPSQDDIIESLGLQDVSEDAIGFATDHYSLESLLRNQVENIVILNDIQLYGPLNIDYSVTLAAYNTTAIFSHVAHYTYRHFYVTADNVTVTFQNVELTRGGRGGGITVTGNNCTLENVAIYGCFTEFDAPGGAIACYADSLYLTDCIIMGNSSDANGGGVYANNVYIDGGELTGNEARESSGGAIYASYISAQNCRITGNSAQFAGGGIRAGYLSLSNSTVENNSSYSRTDGYGGGIYCNGLSAYDSSISNNRGSNGGGVYANSAYLVNVDFYGNEAGWLGGAIEVQTTCDIYSCTISSNNSAGDGGGIYAPDNAYVIVDGLSLISLNTATYNGGGIMIGSASNLETGPNVIFYRNTPNDIAYIDENIW